MLFNRIAFFPHCSALCCLRSEWPYLYLCVQGVLTLKPTVGLLSVTLWANFALRHFATRSSPTRAQKPCSSSDSLPVTSHLKLSRIVGSSSWKCLYKELKWNTPAAPRRRVCACTKAYTWGADEDHSKRFWLVTASRCPGHVAVGGGPSTRGASSAPVEGPLVQVGRKGHIISHLSCLSKQKGWLPPTSPCRFLRGIGDFIVWEPQAEGEVCDLSYPHKEIWLLWCGVWAAPGRQKNSECNRRNL